MISSLLLPLTNYEKVFQFHVYFNALINSTFTIPDLFICNLRLNLINEESNELIEAISNNDIIKIADGIADTLYVTYGTGVSFGIKLNEDPIIGKITDRGIAVNVACARLIKIRMELPVVFQTKKETTIKSYLRNIIHSCYAIGKCYDLDINKIFNIVHESNMSKSCATEQDAIDTVGFYTARGTSCRYEESADKFIVLRTEDNKILKSINYTPANLEFLRG